MSFRSIRSLLGAPVSGESLAVFRILAGMLMLLEAITLCVPMPDMVSTGRTPLEAYFTAPGIRFHAPYPLFSWVPVPAEPGMHVLVAALGVSGILMAAGAFYRLTSVTTFLLWGWLYVAESMRTYWRSDYYLDVLLLFLLMWMPAERCFSVDAWRRRRRLARGEGAGSPTEEGVILFWPVFLLRAQLVLAYTYAGVTKFSADWLLDAAPVRWFLARPAVAETFRHALPPALFHSLESLIHSVGFAYAISWIGMLFDLSVGFLLLGRRTRVLGLVLMTVFHLTNHFLIFSDIAWFPLVGITTSWIFLDPGWPAACVRWLRRPRIRHPDIRWLIGGMLLLPGVGGFLGWRSRPLTIRVARPEVRLPRWVPGFVAIWMVLQVLIPIRGWFIAGDDRFTWEGLSFAWRLKADTRHAYVPEITLDDPAIVEPRSGTPGIIHWDRWPGERTLFHDVDPRTMDWESLPELLVVTAPGTGERVVFNSLSRQFTGRTREAARVRVLELWRERFGHEPAGMIETLPLLEIADRLVGGLRDAGESGLAAKLGATAGTLRAQMARGADASIVAATIGMLADQFDQLRRFDAGGSLAPYFQRLAPFVMESGGRTPSRFLVIQDPAVLRESSSTRETTVIREVWRAAEQRLHREGDHPLEVFTAGWEGESIGAIPGLPVRLTATPEGFPRVVWNLTADATPSQWLHLSSQPFLLRRYAVRVADLWQARTGRRPAVHALTRVSFNGRPYQPLVDPAADLASVSVHWFRHNPWVEDLHAPRIPPEMLVPGRLPASVF